MNVQWSLLTGVYREDDKSDGDDNPAYFQTGKEALAISKVKLGVSEEGETIRESQNEDSDARPTSSSEQRIDFDGARSPCL